MPKTVHSLTAEAVVLRHSEWGEADRLLVLYTRETGKLRAVAKGVRKLLSRKAGHLQPFTRVKVLLAHGRDFWIVSQAETVEAYLALRDDLLRVAYANYVIELLDRFTYDEGANPLLYQLLVDTLERVSTLSDPFMAVRYFEIHVLDLVGFRPELFRCVECSAAVQAEDQFFDALMGGVICPRCVGRFPAARPVSMETLKFLRHLQRSTFKEAMRANPAQPERVDLETLLNYFITYLLERRLNTPHFLHEVRHDRYKTD